MSDLLADIFEYSPGLLFCAAGDGSLLRVSKALRDHLAAPLADDAKLTALGGPEDGETISAFVKALATADGPLDCSIHVPSNGGEAELMRCRAHRSEDGTIHGVLDRETDQARIERMLLRTIMDTLEIVLWAVDTDGKFVFHDGKALATAGLTPGQFLGLDIFTLYPEPQLAPIRAALEGSPSYMASEAHGVHWETWNVGLRNDEGDVKYCVGLSLDVSDNRRTQLALEQQLETIKKQQEAIQVLSSPVIEVWDQVLTVPLVGVIHDSDRIDQLGERLLDRVTRSSARFVILDLTGVESIDTSTAGNILRIVRSLGLLGSEGMLTGISPIVAQTLVSLGIDLSAVATRRTLRDGLRYCMNALGK